MYEQVRTTFIKELYDKVDNTTMQIIVGALDYVMADYDITIKETHLVPYSLDCQMYIDLYVASRAVEGYSKAGLKNYRYDIEKFFEFTHKNVGEIDANDIRKYLYVYKTQKNVQDITLNNIRMHLNNFYEWLVMEDYVPKNPVIKVKKIKSAYHRRVSLTTTELEQLRNACANTRETALIEFLFSTGCRISEVAKMKLDDIDYRNNEVHIYNGKGKKDRITYISSKAVIAIKDYIQYDRPSDSEYLFPNKFNKQITEHTLRDLVETIASRTTIQKKITPHVLRHTFATIGMARGMKPQSLQSALGHESISTTMLYADVLQEDVKMEHTKYIV